MLLIILLVILVLLVAGRSVTPRGLSNPLFAIIFILILLWLFGVLR